ncbi:helix-turn-helix transcriptional regulator [Enterococcus gallinarum]|jgi:DNA-binding Xre family transcriptional regulator|uniref:Helix-turn-helix transcriptional regulator n=2 Tax=Enterococcus TaxID=1350 RepID=A0AAE4HMR9_ENTGA|nr:MULTISPECIES: helix-turn-helix transcriptional regulator [Enterococcus]MDT2687110.1 helix-turn-helix transcriptional regulator [Enterococcus gallinarum]MDT2689742.1 helix-turn-helix transcriptional regulator [Enterococcus gallinarum]OTN75444.1 hypothetical protein A5886_000514 [Enterococcus sp. 8G7_MSG3316]
MLYFKLDKIMDKRKLSINKVSSETKISRPALTAMYNNESRGVQFETLEKLMEYFKVPLEELIGDKINKNLFIFKTITSKENLVKAENGELESRDDGFVEVKPSQTLPYDAVLMENEKIGDKFSFVVYPIDNLGQSSPLLFKQEKRITTLLIAFYRADENGKKVEISDINTFLGNLNTEAAITLAQNIFNSWFSIYRLLKKESEIAFSDFLLFDIGLMGRKTRIPLIAKVEKKNKGFGILLNFDTFKKESKIQGNDKYSSSLEFKEIPGDMQIPKIEN